MHSFLKIYRAKFQGVNQLRKAVQQAFDVHGNKETPLRYVCFSYIFSLKKGV